MEEHSDESGFLGNDDEDRKDKIPYPVLEFGIVNRLFGETGGEIIDASLNVVANVNARDADPVLKDALDAKQRSKHLRKFNFQGGQHDSSIMSDTMSDDDTTSGRMSLDSKQSRRHKRSTTSTILDSIIKRQHLTVDEDPSSSLINKRLFSKMEIEAPGMTSWSNLDFHFAYHVCRRFLILFFPVFVIPFLFCWTDNRMFNT